MHLPGCVSTGVGLVWAGLLLFQFSACLPDEQPTQVLGFQPALPDELSDVSQEGASPEIVPADAAVPPSVPQAGPQESPADPPLPVPPTDSTPLPIDTEPVEPVEVVELAEPASDPPDQVTKLKTAVGLSPRSHDAAGYIEAIERASAGADVALVQATFAWDFLRGVEDGATYRAAYDWLIAPDATGADILRRNQLGRAFWLSFTDPNQPQHIPAPSVGFPVTFAAPQVQAAFVAECAWFAEHFAPDYLALGVEVETYLAAATPEERNGFLAAFLSARDACKAARPACRVFMYFQYENVQARDLWSTIAPFARAGDVYAFSSYPSMPMAGTDTGWTSGTLSDTYYDDIVSQLGADRPVVIAELGHPAAPSAYFSAGGDLEQAAMIRAVFRSLAHLDVALVSWTYLHDPDLSSVYSPELSEYFGAMGLLRTDQMQVGGPGWDAWLRR